eukprot:TRINITY_DN1864_c0_g2_i2.p3 TRINITY_DN1864_c0_g2~~TRINITY_DN1864_c0_g2_i2.p3  ORF type:complete len:102 (+),score=6.64 TRINITY_DN1864_c0_g2_i2:381-686(+)
MWSAAVLLSRDSASHTAQYQGWYHPFLSVAGSERMDSTSFSSSPSACSAYRARSNGCGREPRVSFLYAASAAPYFKVRNVGRVKGHSTIVISCKSAAVLLT